MAYLAALRVLRARLSSAVPAVAMAWEGIAFTPPANAVWGEERLLGQLTSPAECGVGAIQRTELTWGVALYAPASRGVDELLTLAQSIGSAMRADPPLLVDGRRIRVTAVRIDPPREVRPHTLVSVTIDAEFDHTS
jgi:hypothetical protein